MAATITVAALLVPRSAVLPPAGNVSVPGNIQTTTYSVVVAPAPPARRVTLDDVRRDWGIAGQLDCRVVPMK